jgi:UDP-glucuronate 4-epimerase
MALFLFTRAILAGEPIRVFNHGRHRRSFTYVDDIVEGIVAVLDQPPAGNPGWDGMAPDPATSLAPYRLFNIGNEQPVELLRYIEVLEACLGRKAQLEMLPLQAGDVPDTEADVSALVRRGGYKPVGGRGRGRARFVAWYREYYAA